MRTTSWSDDDLLRLCDASTHRIITDSYGDYWWQNHLDGHWSSQCIKPFDTYNKAFEYLRFNLSLWLKEANSRQFKLNRITLKDNKRKATKINRIMNNSLPKRDKITALIDLLPDTSTEELSELLNVSARTVRRYLAGQRAE